MRLAVETGVAGLSIEDSTGDPAHPLRDIDDRGRAACAPRARRSTQPAATRCWSAAPRTSSSAAPTSTTRSRGCKAYAEAGADCLYAPGIRTREQIAAVVAAVAPKPVNLLVGSASEFTLQDIAALGVRRISVGGALARSAWGGFMRAARSIAEAGPLRRLRRCRVGQ